ncbi:MAG: hypothetical protein JXQ29_13030 [Planctomycetes bacterium]|nr:hypothetical protein [Planctomycetota bacterium]
MQELARLGPRWLIVWICCTLAAAAQPVAADPPDPAAILGQALAAHRGPQPSAPPRTLWFKGNVLQVSPKGDRNEADVEQWFVAADKKSSIVTRIAVPNLAGGERVSIRGFDGRRYFLVLDGVRTIITGNPTYEKDQAAIDQDLALTRFLIDHFLVGSLLVAEAKLEYLGRVDRFGVPAHRIRRTAPDGAIRVFYVDARADRTPYFLGIEFPKTKDQPKHDYRFDRLRAFGACKLHQEIRIHEDDSEKFRMRVWIEDLRVDGDAPPAWVPSRRP